jgi:4-amino-4-deoxy-L-arabinose transferase-like glycosyltransferase
MVLFHGSIVMPDSIFTACCLGAIILLDRSCSREGRGSLTDAALAGALAAAAFLIRSLGVTLVPLVLYLLWKRKWRPAAAFLLASGLLALPCVISQAAQPVSTDPVESYYTGLNYLEGNLLALKSFDSVQHLLLSNAVLQLFSPRGIFGLGTGAMGALLGTLLSLIALAGLAGALTRGTRLAAC